MIRCKTLRWSGSDRVSVSENRNRSGPTPSLRRRGAAALEFAVVAPALFALIWIAFEFMRSTMIQEQANIASYEAARAVMVPGSTIAEAHAEANKYLTYLGTRSVTVNVYPYNAQDQVQNEIDDYTARVEVNISIPFASNALVLGRFLGDRTITSSTTLTFESYSGFYDGTSY